jgi:hypothetical protein
LQPHLPLAVGKVPRMDRVVIGAELGVHGKLADSDDLSGGPAEGYRPSVAAAGLPVAVRMGCVPVYQPFFRL